MSGAGRLLRIAGAIALLCLPYCIAARVGAARAEPVAVRLLRQTDDRAPPSRAEIVDGRGSGYLHLSRSPTAFVGSAFVAYSPSSLLTAAHVFSDGRQWTSIVRGRTGAPDFSKLRFFLDACGRSYDIRTVHLHTNGPYRRGQDIALVVLSEPVCLAAQGVAVRALDARDIGRLATLADGSISIQAYQRLRHWAPQFGKLVSYGRVLGRVPAFGGDNLLAVTASTLRGASGGPVIGHDRGTAAIVGMLVAEPQNDDHRFNIAIAADRELEGWARGILAMTTGGR